MRAGFQLEAMPANLKAAIAEYIASGQPLPSIKWTPELQAHLDWLKQVTDRWRRNRPNELAR
jgi:hypothetical protein